MRQLIALVLLLATATSVAAQPASSITEHWRAHNADSRATIDHSAFTAFLQKYVVERDDAPNLVRYGAVTAADRQALQAYIRALTAVPLSRYNRSEQLAYWLNLYNAALLNLVLQHYPIASVRDINQPWDTPVVKIDGVALTLAQIRTDILWPIWREPMACYGLSWAALGGPELRASAYRGSAVYAQLRAAAKAFVRSPQGFAIKNDRLYLSRFFTFNKNAFGRSSAALISQLREHVPPASSARLDIFDRIAGFRFNWQLNAANPRQ